MKCRRPVCSLSREQSDEESYSYRILNPDYLGWSVWCFQQRFGTGSAQVRLVYDVFKIPYYPSAFCIYFFLPSGFWSVMPPFTGITLLLCTAFNCTVRFGRARPFIQSPPWWVISCIGRICIRKINDARTVRLSAVQQSTMWHVRRRSSGILFESTDPSPLTGLLDSFIRKYRGTC